MSHQNTSNWKKYYEIKSRKTAIVYSLVTMSYPSCGKKDAMDDNLSLQNRVSEIRFNSFNSNQLQVLCYSVIVSSLFVFENIILSAFTWNKHICLLWVSTRTYSTCEYFGRKKRFLYHFNGWDGGKNMVKYEEISRFIDACTPFYR